VDWQANLKALAVMAGEAGYQDDPDFLAIVPDCIASAENRILRDLDLLSTRVTDDTGALTGNSKVFVLPRDIGTFIVVEQLRILIPSFPGGPATPGVPLLPASKDLIDSMWPSDVAPTSPSVPTMWCPNDQVSVFVGGPPDQGYTVSTYGTMRPAPLSPKPQPGYPNGAPTFISTQLRDLFLSAEMIFISAEQHNFSAAGDDPQTAVHWLGEYERLKASAGIEEFRKKLQSVGWGSRLPAPTVDTPPV